MSNPTEWDIQGGNFNKRVEFPETITEEPEVKPVAKKKKSSRINPDFFFLATG